MSQVIGSDQQVRWSQVEDTFVVGNFQGNFVGYIDQSPEGVYRTYDKTSTLRGEAETLDQAMAGLTEAYFATAHQGARR